MMNRRMFFRHAAAASAAPVMSLSGAAQTPPKRVGGPFLKLSCNLYTFNNPLRRGEMTLSEVLEFCARLGFAAVDPTGYYFPNYPEAPPDSYLYEIKRQAFMLGLDISGTGVRNDFTLEDPARRDAEITLVSRWIGCAVRLGAPMVRVFAGAAMPEGPKREEVTVRLVDCLRRCADEGGRHGILVAVQNHADFIQTADQVLDILKRVDSPWLGLHLDIGSFRTGDPYDEIEKVVPHAVNWQIKENVWYGKKEVKTDLPRLVAIIRRGGYRGYLPLETLGEGDPKQKLPRFLDEVRAALA